jgi:hypothetical protein
VTKYLMGIALLTLTLTYTINAAKVACHRLFSTPKAFLTSRWRRNSGFGDTQGSPPYGQPWANIRSTLGAGRIVTFTPLSKSHSPLACNGLVYCVAATFSGLDITIRRTVCTWLCSRRSRVALRPRPILITGPQRPLPPPPAIGPGRVRCSRVGCDGATGHRASRRVRW